MTRETIDEIISRAEQDLFPERVPITAWEIWPEEGDHPSPPEIPEGEWRRFSAPGIWGGYDRTCWFRTTVVLPRSFRGRPVVIHLEVPEGLLYVNGLPYQGIDEHHREARLTSSARGGERFTIHCQAYSGRKREKARFGPSFVAVLDPDARWVRSAVTALGELRSLVPGGSDADALDALLRTIEEAAVPSLRGEGPLRCSELRRHLTGRMEERALQPQKGLLHLIAHSHIDVVWLWRFCETERKCGRTFSTALRMMEEFPSYTFMQSQALLYDYTKRRYPSLYRQIRRRIAEGRWHPVGSTWVEPDCNIPNGESLVRQVVYGKLFFEREFGIDSRVLWLPDTFGYSQALPQILRLAGVPYFSTTKLTWNDTTRFPHSTFWWEGIDGSRVLTHITPLGLEAEISPRHLKGSWDRLLEQGGCCEALQTFGYGDGGGGPVPRHLEAFDLLRSAPGLPSSSLSTVESFFHAAESRGEGLPVWNDELYLEMHRGTYTTHGWVKKENRQAETLLYTTELLASLSMVNGKSRSYPAAPLERAWKRLLLTQFHDIVPGSSIREVYPDVAAEYRALWEECAPIQGKALQGLTIRTRHTGGTFACTVFNPLNWTRAEYLEVEIPFGARAITAETEAGSPIPIQILQRKPRTTRVLCYLDAVPPLGFQGIIFRKKEASGPPASGHRATPTLLETELFSLRLDGGGRIASLVVKDLQRECIPPGKTANEFQAFHDLPEKWEAWEIERGYGEKPRDLFRFAGTKVLEHGPLRSILRTRFTAPSGSAITQEIVAYHASRRIDFRTRVLWKEKRTLLKAAFPSAVETSTATFEIQFGALSRTTVPASPADEAKFEVPGQQWADLSDTSFGVSLLNNGKYGYDARGNTLRLTLLRSPGYPHPITPERMTDGRFTDQGIHEFTYALYPHAGDWRDGETCRRGRELNVPVVIVPAATPRAQEAIIRVDDSAIQIDAVKKGEHGGGLIVRLHESHGRDCAARISVHPRVSRVCLVNLMEREPVPVPMEGNVCVVGFRPFGIVTLELQLRR